MYANLMRDCQNGVWAKQSANPRISYYAADTNLSNPYIVNTGAHTMCSLTNVDFGASGAAYTNGGCIIVPDSNSNWVLKAQAYVGTFFAYCQVICFD